MAASELGSVAGAEPDGGDREGPAFLARRAPRVGGTEPNLIYRAERRAVAARDRRRIALASVRCSVFDGAAVVRATHLPRAIDGRILTLPIDLPGAARDVRSLAGRAGHRLLAAVLRRVDARL